MRGSRFDEFSKALASASPRRAFLMCLAAGPLAVVAARLGLVSAAAQGETAGPPRACLGVGQPCRPGGVGPKGCCNGEICEQFTQHACVTCVKPSPAALASCQATCRQLFPAPVVNGGPPIAPGGNPSLQPCLNECNCSTGPGFAVIINGTRFFA